MNLGLLAAKNVARNKFRTTLTILGIAVAILAFVLLRTVLHAWTIGVDYAAKDRVATRHKVTFVMTVPKRYVEEIRNVPGVKAASFFNWFGGKDPKHETEFFATLASDAKTMFEVYDEVKIPQSQREQWLQDRQGAVVGDVLAKKFGWKVGDRINLTSGIFPGEWQFRISGIYTATRKSVDRSTFFFHWDYLNESLPQGRLTDQVGWIASRIDNPAHAADIAKRIDKLFDDRDVQTLSMSERAMNVSFMGMFSAILKAINIVSIVILVIMMLILGNTIAMGVRERTNEYGMMRAVGFLPRHVAVFVLGESIVTALVGGAVGLVLAVPLVSGLGQWIEENMGSIFPYFRVAPSTVALALAASVFLGIVAAFIPARQAARLHVVDALRRVD